MKCEAIRKRIANARLYRFSFVPIWKVDSLIRQAPFDAFYQGFPMAPDNEVVLAPEATATSGVADPNIQQPH